ncbi:MAG: glycosyltransferase family 4 protein [Myxococcales bacterium]|nr:glycosyltransferase family 4 protein [Myxococcales bacterium]
MSGARRILHITRDFPPKNNGGLSTAVGGLLEAQARAGIECVVVSFDDYRSSSTGAGIECEPGRSSTESGITIIRIADKEAIPRAKELAANFGCDVVHVHHESLWEFASSVARPSRAPTVYTVHVLQAEQNRLRDVEKTNSSEAQLEALRECSIVHAPSRAVADLLMESPLRLDDRLKMVRLGCEPWPGAIEASEQERFSGDPMLLYVGRFADINGFGQLLGALPSILAAHPTLQVTLAGGLPDNLRAEKRWKKRWDKLGGESAARVRWAGWLGREQLSCLYGRATALVLPSWFETFGQVALEGMLHGAPLITTGSGAIGEIANEGNALIIESKSIAAIVNAVDALISDPVATEARRMKALQAVEHGQLWDDRIEDFRTIYQLAVEA